MNCSDHFFVCSFFNVQKGLFNRILFSKNQADSPNLAETSSDHLRLPLVCEILRWLGCPEAATESGRAAEQLSHPYLHSNMAAHRLCMVHAVWGHVLPQIMGRQSTQNTPSENLQYTWTIVIINAPGYLWWVPVTHRTSWLWNGL